LAREFAPLCFGQCQDLISDRRIERLQTLKLLKLCLVQSQKGQFERQSCFAHNLKIVKYWRKSKDYPLFFNDIWSSIIALILRAIAALHHPPSLRRLWREHYTARLVESRF